MQYIEVPDSMSPDFIIGGLQRLIDSGVNPIIRFTLLWTPSQAPVLGIQDIGNDTALIVDTTGTELESNVVLLSMILNSFRVIEVPEPELEVLTKIEA